MHKSLRKFSIIVAMTLSLGLSMTAAPVWAQDSDSQVVENNGRRSQPGVVNRVAPNDGDSAEPAAAPAAEENKPDAPSVGVEGGVIFGESLDFEQNFGKDFNVKSSPKNLKITLDFRDAELSDVVKLMSAQTGRNFIVADSLRAGKKITIISPNPVTQNEAYQAFLSALQMNGLTVVQNGKFYKIVELSNGVKEPITATYGDASIPHNDALVTHIATLDYVDVTQIKPVLEQLKTANGVIVDYPASNSLIITDTGNSVNRMLAFIKKMDNDSSDGEKIWVYPVQYASVTDLEKLLTQVFQIQKTTNRNNNNNNKAAESGSELRVSQVVADERTNKLIIVADERSYEKMKRLILKLDVEIPDSGKINVVHLQNSEAKEIYTALNQIISDMSSKNNSNRNNNAQNNSQRTLQGEDISVVSSESTNDLIVVASPRDFLAIKNVIKELDRPRRQVFVEAIILEISLERSRSLGIVMHGGDVFDTGSGDGYVAGRTELNSLSSISPAAMFVGAGSTPGFLLALAGPSFEIAGASIPGLGAVINALQTNTDVNVLSTPTILTLDNQEAKISVGERIPYVTSTGSNYSSLLNGALGGANSNATTALGSLLSGYGTSIERVDVALTLTIKPQINEGGTVRLDIEEEIEEVKPGGSDLGGPSTRRRNLKTVVVVPDQQTVVLGGLVRDSESQSVSKVPLLGDIPVLGYLFRSTETTIQKQNLLLLLTPFIIESYADLDKITKRKQAERDEFVAFFGRKDMNYTRSVDYDKKHGLLEEIRQSIDAKESELNAIREAQNIVEMTSDDEGIDLPDGFSDGYTSTGGSFGGGNGGGGNGGGGFNRGGNGGGGNGSGGAAGGNGGGNGGNRGMRRGNGGSGNGGTRGMRGGNGGGNRGGGRG